MPWAITLEEAGDVLLGAPLRILLILVVAVVANRLLRKAVKRALRSLRRGAMPERLGAALLETSEHSLRAEQRMESLTSVLRSIVSVVVAVVAAFMVLGELGIELGPLLAGAGILGVALGFGSQALVKDFLSGLFILVEDQFGVGDVVDLDRETSGTVEAVSLRTTRLRSVDGTVWHVPNGDIRRVGNMSQHWSRALLDIEVAYGTDLARAQEVIRDETHAVALEDAAILEDPEVWGVEQLSPNGVVIRLVVKTTPSEQWRVSRVLRQRIADRFAREGIEIALPQQVVWNR
jgi:moderate conductance mechanosensitive channel